MRGMNWIENGLSMGGDWSGDGGEGALYSMI